MGFWMAEITNLMCAYSRENVCVHLPSKWLSKPLTDTSCSFLEVSELLQASPGPGPGK